MPRYFMSDTQHPMRAQRSGSHGERRSSEVSEPCRLRRGERYGACDDAMMDPSRPSPPRITPRQKTPQKKPPHNRPASSAIRVPKGKGGGV